MYTKTELKNLTASSISTSCSYKACILHPPHHLPTCSLSLPIVSYENTKSHQQRPNYESNHAAYLFLSPASSLLFISSTLAGSADRSASFPASAGASTRSSGLDSRGGEEGGGGAASGSILPRASEWEATNPPINSGGGGGEDPRKRRRRRSGRRRRAAEATAAAGLRRGGGRGELGLVVRESEPRRRERDGGERAGNRHPNKIPKR